MESDDMSGFYIPGFEPSSEGFICYIHPDGTVIKPTSKVITDDSLVVFKGVRVPDHGRLIDGDVAEVVSYSLEDSASDGDFADGILYAADWIASQPTIIPADKEG